MDPREAEAAARRQFGNVTVIREESRLMWGFSWLEALEQDLRYAVRLFRRTPWFTAVTVLSLAAGIGSAATIFSITDAVLLRLLPVRAPNQLREFTATLSLGAGAKHVRGVDPATLRDLRGAADFADLVGFQVVEEVTVGVGQGTAARTVRAECVSENYFTVLGVAAASGRILAAGDTGVAPLPVVLSERLWRVAFGDDPSVASRTVTINGVPAAIVGVASAFRGLVADQPADIFLPLEAAPLLDARTVNVPARVLARLRPGVTPAVAEQKMAALYVSVGPPMARSGELRVTLTDARHGVSDTRAPLTRPLLIGLVLAALLLLVSCANAGGLLLARSAARHGEFGLRLAIGASRARLIQQLTTEALLLSVMAAAAGLLVATTASRLLLRLVPAGSTPPAFEVRFDWRLVVFTAIVSAGAALIAGGVSLFRVTRTEPSRVLNANARTVVMGPRRMTRLLIAAQVASSLLLVVGAAAMTRTLINLRGVDPGFDVGEAFAIRVDATGRAGSPSAVKTYHQQLLDRISAAPHIARVSVAQVGMMSGAATTGTVDIPGFVPRADDDRWIRMFWVGPTFFETLGMRLVLGEGLERQNSASGERVAVVNQQFARFYFGSPEQALGRTVNGTIRIVGVVADARYDTLRDEPARAVFVPFTQAPSRNAMTFVVRPEGDRRHAVEAALSAIRAHDAQLRVSVMNLADQMEATLLREHFMTSVAAVLSCLAVFLSCAGLYAAVSYATSERRSEFAVRLALGATATNIVTLVLREPLRTALTGVAFGIPGAYAVMRAASSLLYGIQPFDVVTVLISGLVLTAAAVAAALWPALRAGRIDPLAALRAQ